MSELFRWHFGFSTLYKLFQIGVRVAPARFRALFRLRSLYFSCFRKCSGVANVCVPPVARLPLAVEDRPELTIKVCVSVKTSGGRMGNRE